MFLLTSPHRFNAQRPQNAKRPRGSGLEETMAGRQKGAAGVFAARLVRKKNYFSLVRCCIHGDGNPNRTRSAISPLPVGTVGRSARKRESSFGEHAIAVASGAPACE